MLEMGLLMDEKVFIAEYYFCSYGSCEGEQSLKKMVEKFWERFKTAPSDSYGVYCYKILPYC